jgi:hypothetical protein
MDQAKFYSYNYNIKRSFHACLYFSVYYFKKYFKTILFIFFYL